MDDTSVWIGTSWKMHKCRAEALAFARALLADSDDHVRIRRFVMPPFTTLRDVAEMLSGTGISVGAQNMHWDDSGAWTGEVSAPMLRDCGASMVELGHSERRAHFGETDEGVGLKVAAALRNGLRPLICIGETGAEKVAGQADTVLARQVRGALAHISPGAEVLFAYEPVWAIGAGGTPASTEYANERQIGIKAVAADILGQAPPCLYGGSVNACNCADLIACPDIDGLFIGRAAWEAAGYNEILRRCGAVI